MSDFLYFESDFIKKDGRIFSIIQNRSRLYMGSDMDNHKKPLY
jgi:hypothetical protein